MKRFDFDYSLGQLLHQEDFSAGFERWHHEGIGQLAPAPGGGMRLHCLGSTQGHEACMAFFKPNLPDRIAVSYDLTVRSQGGLVINYIAIRGLAGEDLVADRDKLPPRSGVMADYFSKHRGLQSFHLSMSRFNDKGQHTGTCNVRRNPGSLLVAHGMDMIKEINRTYRITLMKDAGHLQLLVDDQHILGVVERDVSQYPIPDTGKFGFRLIGSDVKADIANFTVHQLQYDEKIWRDLFKDRSDYQRPEWIAAEDRPAS